jgi:hypothetical protein
MQALFTGALGDFIGAESFMTNEEKDAVTTILWATRNREEIRAAVDLTDIFPNLKEEKILFDDFCDERPTRPWQEGDRFINIHKKNDLNRMCGLNLSDSEMEAISDHSLDATLEGIFSGQRRFQGSRFATRSVWPSIAKFQLPQRYVVIHPWSDAEYNGREFSEQDWVSIIKFLDHIGCKGVVVNKSKHPTPVHSKIIDLTNATSIKETWAIIAAAESCILCASSLACFATKLFPKDRIWLKGGHEHMFSQWATYFYHGPFIQPDDIIFRNLQILDSYRYQGQATMLDQGYATLL